jgi:hypothetical protein
MHIIQGLLFVWTIVGIALLITGLDMGEIVRHSNAKQLGFVCLVLGPFGWLAGICVLAAIGIINIYERLGDK